MQYTIKNNLITLTVDEQACEMHSLKRNDSDYEYLWQGHKEFWWGRNPTLFPLVGTLKERKYIFKGKEYVMKNHGFARQLPFTLIDKGNDYLVFELKENEETLKLYPFNFSLKIKYSIDGSKVNINYSITNNDNEIMPFCFGLHPAFNMDLSKENKVELPSEDDVVIEDSLFEKVGTYILDPVKSKSVKLITGDKEIKVNFNGFPILAIWKPLNAPFVCIEPWHSSSLSLADIKADEFFNWKWTIKLDPNKVWNTEYSIEI